MYEFGEELIIESYKVPWLIWIQLLVMILLVILLFFGFSILDDLPSDSTSAASSSQGPNSSFHGNAPCNSTATLQHRYQNQSTKRETEASSTSHDIARSDESQEKEGSTEKDATIFKLLVRPQHPCNYFGLAKQAFLKCLGFDSDGDNCNSRRHAKED